MIIVGDGSHWVTPTWDIDGLMWKATDGGSFVDPSYAQVHSTAKQKEIPFCAMHYQEAVSSVESELANITRTVTKDTAIVIDVEKNSGDPVHTFNLVRALTATGYHVPFTYLPEWYWNQIGKPDLSTLPPLWASHYVPGKGDPRQLFKGVPISWWDGYGGNAPMLLQFTRSGSLPGGTMGDYSLFNGTKEQFARFLDPSHFIYPNLGDTLTENIMIPWGKNVHIAVTVAGYSKFRIPLGYLDTLEILQFDFTFDTPVSKPGPDFVPGAGFNGDPDGDGVTTTAWKVQPNRPGPWTIPPGATELSLRVNNTVPQGQVVYLGLGN